ncbi:MAG: EpsG family protein [Alistipes sp.]
MLIFLHGLRESFDDIFYLLAIFAICTAVFVARPNTRTKNSFLFVTGVVLFFLAGFRSGNAEYGLPDGDYEVYISYFRDFGRVAVEPTFKWIAAAVHACDGDYIHLFLVYAFGVAFKLLSIGILSDLLFCSVAVYVSHFFILHEMVQIRASVAAGLLMLSFVPLYERKPVRFVITVVCAALFHVSALMILPFYFLNTKSINVKWYGALLPIAYLLYFSGASVMSLFSAIPVPYIQHKVISYQELMESGVSFVSNINVFNSVHLIQCAVVYLMLTKIRMIVPPVAGVYLFKPS